jgi:pimeloyl-ACP methyl ester carboxylesterase
MKVAIILTGHHEATPERYDAISDMFRSCGWDKVEIFESDWTQNTVQDLVDNFLLFMKKFQDNDNITLLGFSLGGMVWLLASNKIILDHLILCSPSGYFKELVPYLKKEDSEWADINISDFRNISAVNVIKNSRTKAGFVIAGGAEIAKWYDLKRWINIIRKSTNWEYIELRDIGHEIESNAYQNAIKEVILKLA